MASGTVGSRDSIVTRTWLHSLHPLDLFPLCWFQSPSPVSIPLRFIFSEQERSLWIGPIRTLTSIWSMESRKVTVLRYPQGPQGPVFLFYRPQHLASIFMIMVQEGC